MDERILDQTANHTEGTAAETPRLKDWNRKYTDSPEMKSEGLRAWGECLATFKTPPSHFSSELWSEEATWTII